MSDLTTAAFAASMDLSAAELHGTVCGIQCAAVRRRMTALRESADDSDSASGDEVLPLDDFLALVGTEAIQDVDALIGFSHLVAEALLADDFRFIPLLPDYDEPIEDRVEALAEWCSAFLAGFAAMGDYTLSEGESEIIEDISAIGSAEAGDAGEEAERSYAEIVEYLKVTVLTLLHPESDMSQ